MKYRREHVPTGTLVCWSVLTCRVPIPSQSFVCWLHGLNSFIFLCVYLGNCEKEVVLSSANTPYLLLDAYLTESRWVTLYTSAALSESVLWTRRIYTFSVKLISFVILFLSVFSVWTFFKTVYLLSLQVCVLVFWRVLFAFGFGFAFPILRNSWSRVQTRVTSQSIKTTQSPTIAFLRQEQTD